MVAPQYGLKAGVLSTSRPPHQQQVNACGWSPDGTRVLSASSDNALRLWDAATGDVLLRLTGHENSVWGCAWSPDGRRVLSASADNTLRLWDAATGVELGPTMYHFNHPSSRGGPTWAAIDRPNNRILACGPDAWRHLGWIVGEPGTVLPVRLPAEVYGPLPVKGGDPQPATTKLELLLPVETPRPCTTHATFELRTSNSEPGDGGL